MLKYREMGEGKQQTHLKPQDAASVDASKLTALTPEVVSSHSVTGMTKILKFRKFCIPFLMPICLNDEYPFHMNRSPAKQRSMLERVSRP